MSMHLHPYNTISQNKHKNLIKMPNDSDDANVDDNGVGKITSASSNVTRRSVSVQVPDEDINMDVVHVVPCQYYEKEEDMAIDPINDELCTPKSKKSMATSINESLFHEQRYDFDEMNVGTFNISSNVETHDNRDHLTSKPTDWDNVSISAIVELEMMKEDLEEGIVENLEKLGRLLNLETRHNGKDHRAMEHEIATLISVLKEEMDASDDEEDDYHRMSDLDEEYDYWKVNSGVLIWNSPLRVDERSDVPNRKVSQCPTLESIKEEDNGEADMDDDKDNGEDETETQNQRTDAERKEREQLKEVETIPSKDVKHTMSTEYTSQGLPTEVDEFADMLSSVIISNALQVLPVKNESNSSSEIANVTVTSGESFSSGSSETIYERKESIPQSEMEITATPTPEHAAVNHSTDHTEPPTEMCSDTTSHEYTAKQTVTSPSDKKLDVTAESSEKTVHSVPTLNSTSMAAGENEREVASAPTLMSSAMQPKPASTCESRNAKKTGIVTESEDGGHSPESEACNDEDMENFTKKVKWSDLPFTSTDDSATLTGSTVTVLVPGESNSCNVSVILTSPSDENLCVTVEPSEKTEMHSVPTLISTPMTPGAADERQIVSAPTLVYSATQLKQVNSHELKSAKMIKENEELHSAPGAFPFTVTANATFDGGNITAANLNIMDDNDDDDNDNEDDNEMVFYAKSGEAVYISSVICSTELGQMSEKSSIAEVTEENRAGDSSTRNATESKATKSLAAFIRCDQKGSNDLHDQRSRAKRLEPFRAASRPNTPSEECKIVLRHICNPDRSKINFDELCTLNNVGTDITPEGLAKTEEGYYPRSRDGQKMQDRSTCDDKHLKRGSCKSASKPQNHVSSLSDTCVHTSDGKTLKRRSHKSASEGTCKHEAESVGKKKRKSSKSNPQSKGASVGRTSANSKSGNVDATWSCNAEIHTRNGKVPAKCPCKLEKSSNQLVTGTYDSECTSSVVSSEERKPLQSIAPAEQTSEERSPSRYKTNKSAFIRCSSDANTSSKYRQAVLKAKSSIGGSVLPSKLSKPKSSVPSFRHGGLNQMATSSEQVKTSRADTLGMSRENDKPNYSVVATERPVSVCAAMLGLGSKSFTSKVTGTVDLDKMIAAKVNLYKERSERNSIKGIEYSQQSWHKGCEMISEQDSRQKVNRASVHELAKKPSRSQSDVKLPPLTQPETISLPKIPLTSDGQGLDATAWIRANRDIILRQASRNKAAGQGCEVISKQDSGQKMNHVSVHELVRKPSRDQSDIKLPPLTQPETISLPKIPLTSDGQGLDATAWIRANRDIILRQASRKRAAGHLNSVGKAGCSMSDKSFDKLPQIVKQENQSLPEMPRGPPSY